MSYAAKIVEAFGGVRPMASELNSPPTTVQGWKDSGRIPAHRQQAVLDAARRRGLPITPADFFDQPEQTAGVAA